jgi:hypothetical protein
MYEKVSRMLMADDERKELTDRNGPLTVAQAAALAVADDGQREVRRILAEPVDPDRNRRGLEAARQAVKEALGEG